MTESSRGRRQQLIDWGRKADLAFKDWSLLDQALTHSSYANECRKGQSVHNERLEFLGDAILDLIVSEQLYSRLQNLPEGELTKARAFIVCESTLAQAASELKLGSVMYLGRGEDVTGGRQRASILADAFEAVIGAVYLDGGIEAARVFVLAKLALFLREVQEGRYGKDYKTLFQETVQRQGEVLIQYEIVTATGPDHNKSFEAVVQVNGRQLGCGCGKSKKEAEQQAARQALLQLDVLQAN